MKIISHPFVESGVSFTHNPSPLAGEGGARAAGVGGRGVVTEALLTI